MQKQNSDNKINCNNVIELLSKEDVIDQSYIFFTKSKKKWRIKKDIVVELSDGKIIKIPAGYEYDMASVPRFLWSFISPFNDGLFGTLIHDYLYVNKIGTVKQADKEYLFWNNITNKNKFDNYLRYYVVRATGWLIWYDIIKIK
jgi:hypothetical protein